MAAARADGQAERISNELVPASTRLLCMRIAARQPGTPAVAIAFAGELLTLSWNAGINQLIGVRDAIAVQRRRREHKQLRHHVLVDDLTGLANRRGYQAYLTGLRQLAVQNTNDEPDGYAVMMIDVDHFKGVNDAFGHDIGDVVPTRIAQVLASNVRPADLAVRARPRRVRSDPGRRRSRRPRSTCPGDPRRRPGHPWEEVAAGLTVSVSIDVHSGGHQKLSALLTDADRRLCYAKKEGRGRVAGHTAR